VRLVTPGNRPSHSHFFCAETDADVGNTSMAVQRQRPSVRPVGLLVDTVHFETVETVKRPSSCPASCTRAGASSSSPVTLPTFVDGVPFETLKIAKRPSSCPSSTILFWYEFLSTVNFDRFLDEIDGRSNIDHIFK